MANYQRILTAIDLSDEAIPVLQRAAAMARQHQAELHLLHVVEPLSLAYGGDIPMDFSGIQEELQQQAENSLKRYADQYGIQTDNCHLLTGRPEAHIHQLSEELDCDLIVVGSHGRKGLALLLGSTANAVLHGAKCDVLSVRVG
ncbi:MULTISPECIES: universal stress protein [Spongiibacter]|jgi:universal stress protein A|uniref:universal stress protein n=1 Tax=Spongiibacter TaxID=630749 RepID=UPI00041FD8CF|nr:MULTISPECIES: universal stress protein [Spongiibacter]MAK44949.1 universal stress protein [Spongiibacter sp.]MBM7422754.1 universal stress protein A [Spongiibacter marinus]MEE2651463.1 universal stress protein [Pseudomonadota bacterium]|tara:strand:+ start:314 stop:745 length:432 start_codon:yes stop_codon:yes gene_type:complete